MSETITIIDIQADNTSLEAAVKSANKLTKALEAAEKINATGGTSGSSGDSGATKRAASSEKAAEREIKAIEKREAAYAEAQQKAVDVAAAAASKRVAVAEKAAQKEVEAMVKASKKEIAETEKALAKYESSRLKEVAAAEKAAEKEINAAVKAANKAEESDKKATASAEKEAKKQSDAAVKAAKKATDAHDKMHGRAIQENKKITASAEKEAKKQQAAAEKSSKAMIRSMTSAAGGMATAFVQMSVSAVSAFTYMAVNAAKSANEIDVLAAQAGMASDAFRALGFATEQYGLSAEQASDMSKDLFDRLGEFTNEGKGELEVLGVALGKNNEQLQEYATTLSSMSGEDAFATIVSDLDDANVSGAEMVSVMEAIANDTSRLIPLYRDQAKELKALKKTYEDMAGAYELSATESKEIKNLNVQFSLLTKEAELAATKIAAAVSPVLIKMFASLSDEIEEATGWISHFFKLMDDKSTESLVKDITDLEARLQDLTDATKGVGFKNWIYDAVASEESKAAIDAEIASLIKQIEEKEKLLGANNQLAKQAEKTKADKDSTLKPSGSGTDTGITATAQKEADQAFQIQQDLQTRSLALMQETEANKFAIAEASAAATSQLERNALDKDFAEKTISYSQHTLQVEMLEKELASKLAGIRGESTNALEQVYADDLALQSSYKDREIALMVNSTEKVNMQHAQRLANLQANLDQGKIDYVQYLDEVAIENAETNADIAATTAKAQAELVNELTSLTSSMLGAISREAEQAFNAIDDLFKLLSNFDWFNGSGGVFGTVGGWMGLAAPDVSAPAPAPAASSATNESNNVKSSAANSNRYNINVHINGVTDRGAIKSAAENGVIEAMNAISKNSVIRSTLPGGDHNKGLGL